LALQITRNTPEKGRIVKPMSGVLDSATPDIYLVTASRRLTLPKKSLGSPSPGNGKGKFFDFPWNISAACQSHS